MASKFIRGFKMAKSYENLTQVFNWPSDLFSQGRFETANGLKMESNTITDYELCNTCSTIPKSNSY